MSFDKMGGKSLNLKINRNKKTERLKKVTKKKISQVGEEQKRITLGNNRQ